MLPTYVRAEARGLCRLLLLTTIVAAPVAAAAQDQTPSPPAAELNLITLPTTTSLDSHKS